MFLTYDCLKWYNFEQLQIYWYIIQIGVLQMYNFQPEIFKLFDLENFKLHL